jgi:hypothetical protein
MTEPFEPSASIEKESGLIRIPADWLNEIRAELKSADRARRMDWDIRGVLAIMSLIGAVGLAVMSQLSGQKGEVPTWAAAMVMSVIGFYFGSKGGGNGKGKGG